MEANPVGYFNAELIEHVGVLEEKLRQLRSERDELSNERDELSKKLELKEQSAQLYKEQVEFLRRQLFGKKSERREVRTDPLQTLLSCFADVERPTLPEGVEKETITYTRTKNPSPGTPLDRSSRFPAGLRRKEITVPPKNTTCECCGNEMTHLIRTEVTEKLCCSRNPFYVTEYHRAVLSCRECEEVAPMTLLPEVFERTAVDHTVAAYLLVNKFRYSVPLYRQGQQMRDMQLVFSNDALIDWARRAIGLLMPIVEELVMTVLKCRYLVADDTKLRAAVGPIKKKLPQYKQGTLWGLYGQDIGAVAYLFTSGRSHQACREVLKGFAGYLIVDGYDGFEQFDGADTTLVHCNNHARRGFVRAEGSDKQRSDEALAFYQALYRIEEEGKTLSPEERTALRQAKAVPVFEQFKLWLDLVHQAATPKSPLGKACAYVLKRWKTLRAYLEDGNLPIDTMAIERAFRVIAVGRKNFLHAASETGAVCAAAAYSLVNTCVIQGIDPFIYLCDVLERVGSCPQPQIHTLLPQNWKALHLEEATRRYQDPFDEPTAQVQTFHGEPQTTDPS